MRPRVVPAVLVCVLLLSPLLSAAQEVRSPSIATAPISSSAFRSVNVTVQAASAQDRERVDWQLRQDSARRRRASGRRLTFIGAGIAGGGTLLGLMAAGDCNYNCEALEATWLFSWIGGGVVATLGGVRWSGASGALADLEREGRTKGYVQIVPMPRGLLARASYAF